MYYNRSPRIGAIYKKGDIKRKAGEPHMKLKSDEELRQEIYESPEMQRYLERKKRLEGK